MHVHESGNHDEPGDIHDFAGFRAGAVTDEGDGAVPNPDVGDKRLAARSVVDEAAAKEEVERRRGARRGGERHRDEENRPR